MRIHKIMVYDTGKQPKSQLSGGQGQPNVHCLEHQELRLPPCMRTGQIEFKVQLKRTIETCTVLWHDAKRARICAWHLCSCIHWYATYR